VNLWEVEAQWVLEAELVPLLPFLPVLRGGQDIPLLQRAVTRLRADPALSELEPLLAFFASFVLETEFVLQIMRWDMAILRESPWYQEILEEGHEQGLEQGRREDVLRVLVYRFGELPAEVETALQTLNLGQIERLFDVALDVATLDEFRACLPPASPLSGGSINPS